MDAVLATMTTFLEDEPSGAALFESQVTALSSAFTNYYGAIVFEEGTGFHVQVDAGLGEAADVSVSGYDLINS